MYLLFAIYCCKFTVCSPLTAVNLLFDLPRVLQSNNGGKKAANTLVNGKLPLAVGNPNMYVVLIHDHIFKFQPLYNHELWNHFCSEVWAQLYSPSVLNTEDLNWSLFILQNLIKYPFKTYFKDYSSTVNCGEEIAVLFVKKPGKKARETRKRRKNIKEKAWQNFIEGFMFRCSQIYRFGLWKWKWRTP